MGIRDDFVRDNPFDAVLRGARVELIGEGKNRKAKCPFHKDNNPSFSVNLDEGSWKCFAGCGAGGVVEFLAKLGGKTPDTILEEYRLKNSSNGAAKEVKPQVMLNWTECVERFDAFDQQQLADWRGYSIKFVQELVSRKMIGMCEGRLSFPIYAGGKVIGTHQKVKGGAWITRGGVGSPWVIGDHFEEVLIFESQWDAFAFMDRVGWFESNMDSLASIVITRGASKGKEIQNLFPTTGRITVVMQNDQLDESGNSPAEKWLLDILSILRNCNVCRPPKQFKDLNDWTRAGATNGDLLAMADEATPTRDPRLPAKKEPLDIRKAMMFEPNKDDSCLLGNRYLCKGGSALWVGGSGIGKSVLNIQAAIVFALGKDLFGIQPKRPLKSVIVSAEDDFGDISEVIQGVATGMSITLSSKELDTIIQRVIIIRESTLKGLPFIGLCEELVIEHKPDLLWINPLLSYFSGNPSDPEKAAEFTGALSSLQDRTGVCSQLVHHTGKPSGDSKSRESWSIEDFSYIGLGSSVWTNWARAIIVLQSLKQPKNTFVLRLAKRGQRAGVSDEEGEKLREIYLKHGTKGLVWELSEFCPEDSGNEGAGRPSKLSWPKVSEAWDGSDKNTFVLKQLISETLKVSDKSAWRAIEKWSGVYITKNTNDMWVKIPDEGQNGQNGQN